MADFERLAAGLSDYDRTTLEYLFFSGIRGPVLERVAASLRPSRNGTPA